LLDGERRVADLTRQVQAAETDIEYRNAVKKVQQYQAATQQQLDELKATHANRKEQRRVRRQNDAITEAELEELGQQSQSDKYEFKNAKRKLQSDGEDPIARLAHYQLEIDKLKKLRKKLSAKLQADLFNLYKIVSSDGQSRGLGEFFKPGLPPSGAGDCAAAKLMHHANVFGFTPLALAEFWWGAAPAGGLREHGRFYPSCRSRCRVVLPFMLQGQKVSVPAHERGQGPDRFSRDKIKSKVPRSYRRNVAAQAGSGNLWCYDRSEKSACL